MLGTSIIAFEGIDGSGKTVQMNLLARALKKRGMRVDTISFPVYGSFFGREIGNYLTNAQGVAASDVDSKSMALWFAMDRYLAFRELDLGDTDALLINRYVLSNAVYQSIRERDLDGPDILGFVMDLEYGRLDLPQPDAIIYLDVNIEEAGANVLRKGYRAYAGNARDVYESQAGMQRRARAKYREYAALFENVFLIPCMDENGMKPEREIAIQVEEALLKHNIF
ncbi:MAG: hypothetical protein LBS18_05005 [Clostridiales bacterium]|jgi:dTMP kinase|nr:hypothetical protein [Clostridiales bacterium]